MLRRLRRGLRVSQRELARRAGVPRSMVERVERGGDALLSTLRRLFEALGCGLTVLPVSEPLRAGFEEKAREKRRSERELRRVCRKLGLPAPTPVSPEDVP
ncbi:MAG: helix-turn-helix transcriptional regulator [Elusimicrobia bacterium]|nr:helix-turn-helix transcriptional regulator [Elusimicrobiota bacterium]